MNPYDAPSGTIWAYDPDVVDADDDPYAHEDGPSIFVLLDGYAEAEDQRNRGRLFRRMLDLESGTLEGFTVDSRLNNYSEQLF